MDDIVIDFLSLPEKEYLKFGKKVKKEKYNEIQVKRALESVVKKEKYSKKEAITLIKNLLLTSQHVPFERKDFYAHWGKTICYVTNFINKGESINYKILYALYKSQIKIKRINGTKKKVLRKSANINC
ncbi:hypothetical protein PIROE2DRAFT_9035 [Piromyces sp. E2]|nr:hypothetical protein PIROE2DRAFT_9035 [Piromyces sp. E2]|eukprot:OUM64273.1 hypothetical protein PIROE2DRAFT_9035 [Piromyces sp. E2]